MDWINTEERLPEDKLKVYVVKKIDETEEKAFFMPDKAIPVCWLNIRKPSYWLGYNSAKLIYDVTHWKEFAKQQI